CLSVYRICRPVHLVTLFPYTTLFRSQRMADIISGYFVPIVIVIAIVTFIVWYFFASPGNVEPALVAAISVLVIACPCALGLATQDRKSTRLNSSHVSISYAVFCLKKK